MSSIQHGLAALLAMMLAGCVSDAERDHDTPGSTMSSEQQPGAQNIMPFDVAYYDDTIDPPDDALRVDLSVGYLTGADGLDVRAAVVGGAAPYSCYIYQGPGEGTVPAGVWPDEDDDDSGCILLGQLEPDWGDMPGNYGFLMTVQDAVGATVEVPVVYFGDPCDTPLVTLAPTPDDSLLATAGSSGSSQSWLLNVTSMDGVSYEDACASCFTMSVLTRNPLSIAANLDCNAQGDVCSDGTDTITYHDTCPGQDIATMRRFVNLASHDPVRDGAGFVTMEISASYSGVSLDPCSGNQWQCHIEALEVPTP